MRGYLLRGVLFIILIVWQRAVASNSGVFVPEDWDRALPSMELKGVSLEGNRMDRLWGKLGQQYFIRSNLYMRDFEEKATFRFEAQSCKVSKLLDAVTAHFGYVWTQAPASGLIWIHPADMEFQDIVPYRVKLGQDYVGIPMLTGIVEQVRRIMPPRTLVPGRWTDSLIAAADYPVSISEGVYSVREILDVCSRWSPHVAFAVFDDYGVDRLEVASLRKESITTQPPGAKLFWELNVGKIEEGAGISDEEIGKAMASSAPRTRWAAREYVRMAAHFEQAELRMWRRVARLSPSEQSAWEIIGFHASRNYRPDRFNTGESTEKLVEFSRPEVSKQFSADAELLLQLTRAAVMRAETPNVNLERLSEVNVENVLFDMLRLSYIAPGVTKLFFDKSTNSYIGNRLQPLPEIPHQAYHMHPADFTNYSSVLSDDIVHPDFPKIDVTLLRDGR